MSHANVAFTFTIRSPISRGVIVTDSVAVAEVVPRSPRQPNVFVSHGYGDRILPFAQCGARIVEQLTREGYAPRFDEFNGGHTATPEMRTAALAWLNGV